MKAGSVFELTITLSAGRYTYLRKRGQLALFHQADESARPGAPDTVLPMR